MRCSMVGEISDDCATARSALNDALQLATRGLDEGLDGNGWIDTLRRLYGEVEALERQLQDAERKAATA